MCSRGDPLENTWSNQGRDSTTLLGNLCQCSAIHTVTKCSLMFRGTLLCFILCPMPLLLPLGTQVLSLFCSLHPHTHPSDSPPWDSQTKPGSTFLVTKQLQCSRSAETSLQTQKLVPFLGQNVSLFPTPIPLLPFRASEEKDLSY